MASEQFPQRYMNVPPPPKPKPAARAEDGVLLRRRRPEMVDHWLYGDTRDVQKAFGPREQDSLLRGLIK